MMISHLTMPSGKLYEQAAAQYAAACTASEHAAMDFNAAMRHAIENMPNPPEPYSDAVKMFIEWGERRKEVKRLRNTIEERHGWGNA
jgi:hypothetical protein